MLIFVQTFSFPALMLLMHHKREVQETETEACLLFFLIWPTYHRRNVFAVDTF